MSATSNPNIFREAAVAEDETLAGIFYNAFLPIWNHNWFHGVSAPLPPIDPSQPITNLPQLQRARYGFYLSLIKVVRIVGGTILILCDDTGTIHAGLLWLPPRRRATATSLGAGYKSGFLRSIYEYGVSSFYRMFYVFEGNIDVMFAKAHVAAAECGMVQMLAANQEFRGNGSASRLLAWQMRRHWEEFPGVDVVLDTSTEQGVRAYRRLGFEVVGQCKVDTGTDAGGFWVTGPVDPEAKAEAERVCVQWVMVKREAQ